MCDLEARPQGCEMFMLLILNTNFKRLTSQQSNFLRSQAAAIRY